MTCLICLDEVEAGDEYKISCSNGCKQIIHNSCYNKPIKNYGKCLICRTPNKQHILINDEEKEGMLKIIDGVGRKLLTDINGPISLMIFLLFAFTITVLYVIPSLILSYISYKLDNIFVNFEAFQRIHNIANY